MKKVFLVFSLMLLGFSLSAARVWTVRTVPNTRLQSNSIHVSDPDGYLSESAEMNINAALCSIRDQADVFLVTLSTIGETNPKRFATELFNYWGIGDAATNNGVLLLFVEDQHALEFETGYGAEATLTDAKCERIFTQTIVPFFRNSDYEGGLIAGVADIVKVYGGEVPEGLKIVLPEGYGEGNSSYTDDMSNFFVFFALFLVVAPIGFFFRWIKRKNKATKKVEDLHVKNEDGIDYLDDVGNNWSGSAWEGAGCLSALLFGFSPLVISCVVAGVVLVLMEGKSEYWKYNWIAIITLVVYFVLICVVHNLRTLRIAKKLAAKSMMPKKIYKAAKDNIVTKGLMLLPPWVGILFDARYKQLMDKCEDYCCPTCRSAMTPEDGFQLTDIHLLEKQLGALEFKPYRCTNGHLVVVMEHGSNYSEFATCSRCGAFTAKREITKTLSEASYSHTGKEVAIYVCRHCGATMEKTFIIPKIERPSSGGGSSSSGGSFGGGSSGGGGYSGRW